MYKLDLPIDTKEAAAIELRRRREKERQARIFDSRTRQIGVISKSLLNSLCYRLMTKLLNIKWRRKNFES